mmetsp:Transcript_50345/g.126816  ORF Transcript_50345/g.126816 Transcript_50345/m.126816 type:complete len:244 (-) Transcript_50345:19-750(-)
MRKRPPARPARRAARRATSPCGSSGPRPPRRRLASTVAATAAAESRARGPGRRSTAPPCGRTRRRWRSPAEAANAILMMLRSSSGWALATVMAASQARLQIVATTRERDGSALALARAKCTRVSRGWASQALAPGASPSLGSMASTIASGSACSAGASGAPPGASVAPKGPTPKPAPALRHPKCRRAERGIRCGARAAWRVRTRRTLCGLRAARAAVAKMGPRMVSGACGRTRCSNRYLLRSR